MANYKRPLIALINQIDHDITQYLDKVKHYVVDNLEKVGELKYRYKHHEIIHQEQGKWLFVVSDAIHNTELTAKRIASLLDIKTCLNTENTNASQCDNLDALEASISNIKAALVEAIRINSRLDMDFKKQHMTYTQNRLQGFGVFSSWWNKSSHQSRSMQQLEKAMSHLDAFVKAHDLEADAPRIQPNRH